MESRNHFNVYIIYFFKKKKNACDLWADLSILLRLFHTIAWTLKLFSLSSIMLNLSLAGIHLFMKSFIDEMLSFSSSFHYLESIWTDWTEFLYNLINLPLTYELIINLLLNYPIISITSWTNNIGKIDLKTIAPQSLRNS